MRWPLLATAGTRIHLGGLALLGLVTMQCAPVPWRHIRMPADAPSKVKDLVRTLMEEESPAARAEAAEGLDTLGEEAKPAVRFLGYSCDNDRAELWQERKVEGRNPHGPYFSMSSTSRRTVGSFACTALGNILGVDGETSARMRKEWEQGNRMALRKLPRLTLHFLFMESIVAAADTSHHLLNLYTGAVALGYRQNYATAFGLSLRLGVGGGIVRADDSDPKTHDIHTDDASAMEIFGHVGPHFGPFGDFYIGPTVWGSYMRFARSTLQTPESTYRVEGGFGGGLGLDMGLFLHEALDLNLGLRSSLSMQVPFRFDAGLTYHFM